MPLGAHLHHALLSVANSRENIASGRATTKSAELDEAKYEEHKPGCPVKEACKFAAPISRPLCSDDLTTSMHLLRQNANATRDTWLATA